MAVLARAVTGDFELTPEGTFQGVIFAIYDLGDKPNKFKAGETVHKVRIGIELNETYHEGQSKGERITKYPEFTLSLSEYQGTRAKLLLAVEAILGRALTAEEKDGFDLESLIGSNCGVQITHKVSEAGFQSTGP